MVGRDREQFRGIRETVDLVEDNPLPAPALQEALGVRQEPPHSGTFTVVVGGVGEGLAQHALSDPAHPHEPDHQPPAPRRRDFPVPEGPMNHASLMAFG